MTYRSVSKQIETWIWKFHIYIGLYLLLFMLLFFISGLLLNHPEWKFTQFWANRRESTFEQTVRLPKVPDDLAKARDIMQQLGLSGEITLVTNRPVEGQFNFRVVRPGKTVQVKTDLNGESVSVREFRVNIWGISSALHLFTGVRGNQERDWFMTKIWSVSIDAVALGLIFLVVSSFYLWYKHKRKRLLGLVILGWGVFFCGFFLFGLNWMN